MLDVVLGLWIVLTLASTGYVAYDLVTRTPEMGVMKLGWVLVLLYTGPVGLLVYLASCRRPRARTHEAFIVPLWKQAVGSTIHCLAGDATGIIAAAALTAALGWPMGVDFVVEYAAGFLFGLTIFQALFMRAMRGGSYLAAIRATILPEFVSMNLLLAGMVPIMAVLFTNDPSAMEPNNARFWGVMSLATIVAGLIAYPVNWWLVATGLKHGMGSSSVLGEAGSDPAHETMKPPPPAFEQALVVGATVAVLVAGAGLAVVLAGPSMLAAA